VTLLLRLGADANMRDEEGWTPLMNSALVGYASVAGVLVDNGADVNAKCVCRGYSDGGWAPLMMAIHKDHGEIAELLLSKGADVNERSTNGLTALILAAGKRDINFVRQLLARGADVNAKVDDRGWIHPTALWAAAREGQIEIVRTLLEA